MRPFALAIPGVLLLLLGFVGAPVIWPLDSALADFGLQVGVWFAATAGVVCLWLAATSEDADRPVSAADPGERPRAA